MNYALIIGIEEPDTILAYACLHGIDSNDRSRAVYKVAHCSSWYSSLNKTRSQNDSTLFHGSFVQFIYILSAQLGMKYR